MKIYFHQHIVKFLYKYFFNIYDRYFNDYTIAIVHKIGDEKNKPLKKELKDYFQLCEFTSDGDCDGCGKNLSDEKLWFGRTSFEVIEENYYCDECALKLLRK